MDLLKAIAPYADQNGSTEGQVQKTFSDAYICPVLKNTFQTFFNMAWGAIVQW